MNNISIESGVLVCTVTYDGVNTISVALKQGDQPVAQWNFFANDNGSRDSYHVARRSRSISLVCSSMFRELTRRRFSYHDAMFIQRCIVQIALLGGELSDVEVGSPYFILITTLTSLED